jgi:hypothetical protein
MVATLVLVTRGRALSFQLDVCLRPDTADGAPSNIRTSSTAHFDGRVGTILNAGSEIPPCTDTYGQGRPVFGGLQNRKISQFCGSQHSAGVDLKSGNCQAAPFRKKGWLEAPGKIISAFMDSRAGKWGMKVPSLNLIQRISAPSFQETTPAVVSGPTTIGSTVPDSRTKTRCQRLSAGQMIEPSLAVQPPYERFDHRRVRTPLNVDKNHAATPGTSFTCRPVRSRAIQRPF